MGTYHEECKACKLDEEGGHGEGLPADSERHHPDDERARAVQHHARRRTHLLRDADPRKVEERNTDDVACNVKEIKGSNTSRKCDLYSDRSWR